MLDYKINYKPTNINISYNKEKCKDTHPTLVVFQEQPTEKDWLGLPLPHCEVFFNRWQQHTQINKLSALDCFTTTYPDNTGSGIAFINLASYESTYKKLDIFKKQLLLIAYNKPLGINIVTYNFNNELEEENTINQLIVCIGSYYTLLPKITQKDDLTTSDSKINIEYFGNITKHDPSRAIAEVHGNGLTRYLCNLPANHLYPEVYREYVQQFAKNNHWQYEFMGIDVLKQKNAGAYLAVIQGSSRKDAGIIKLTYTPKNNYTHKKVTLIGKGLCFDTGGYNLKTPLGSMYSMNHDMTGSAIALGTLYALSNLQVPFEVEIWMALAQNDIGPDAYKPSDVVYASDGTSIEVVNTDAEGRMVLCDTWHLASLGKPDAMFSYATLTGSCVRALDELYSGVITNQYQWNTVLTDIGYQCGERVWPFPYTDDYDEVLKSDIADIKQCHEGPADQIRAARFLGKFVHNNTPWIHIDLSSHAHKGGLGHIHTDTTGFGVRFTLSCLLDSDLFNE